MTYPTQEKKKNRHLFICQERKDMYVNNIIQMAQHISHHRKRIYELGMEVQGNFLLKRIIFGLHDIEKYIFLPWLWKYYGSKGDAPSAKLLYSRMNKLGYFIVKFILFFLPFKKSEINRLKRCEKIIDVIDRHCDPVALEEFDLQETRPLTKYLAVQELPAAVSFKKRWIKKFEKQTQNQTKIRLS